MTKDRAAKQAVRKHMAVTGDKYTAALRAEFASTDPNPDALVTYLGGQQDGKSYLYKRSEFRGNDITPIPDATKVDVPIHLAVTMSDEYSGVGFNEPHPGVNAILTFSGYQSGAGPTWLLCTDDADYHGDAEVLAGDPASPPVAAAIRYLRSQNRAAIEAWTRQQSGRRNWHIDCQTTIYVSAPVDWTEDDVREAASDMEFGPQGLDLLDSVEVQVCRDND